MTSDHLSKQDHDIIQRSSRPEQVQVELAGVLKKPVSQTDFDRELLELRDQLTEVHAEDHAMLIEHGREFRLCGRSVTENMNHRSIPKTHISLV